MKRKPLFLNVLFEILFFSIIALLLSMSLSLAQASPALYSIRNDYIVVLKDDIEDPETVVAEMKKMFKIKCSLMYSHCLKGFSAIIPAPALAKIKSDPRIKYIEPDAIAYAFVQTLPVGVNRIKATRNSAAMIDGSDERVDVDVAIIDTGIDLSHPDLNVVQNVSFVPRASSGNDDNGHGSHVAGIVGAIDDGVGVVGIAPGARLHAVKVLDRRGSGKISWIIAGIDWVTKHADEIEVANMSLGSIGYLQSLRDAIINSVNKGVVYVAAAGNEEDDVYGKDGIFGTEDDHVPAAYPEVAAISAMTDFDGLPGGIGGTIGNESDDTLASFSNFSRSVVSDNPVTSPGAAIDFAAPGVDIYSSYKGGGYKTLSGTSMASPHGAGCVALYISQHGRAHNAAQVAAIRQALIDRAEPQTSWGPQDTKDPDPNHEGLVDAEAIDQPPLGPASLRLIMVKPEVALIGKGKTQAFVATGLYTDGSTREITASVVWSSSDPAVATIDSRGVASGLSEGVVQIRATLGEISSPPAFLTVSASLPWQSILITPATYSIRIGDSCQYKAIATYPDATSEDVTNLVIWSSSDPAVATIDSHGRALGTGFGTAIITARSGEIVSQEAELRVVRSRVGIILSDLFNLVRK
ncbi:MAG: S8 family serine peptidase [bacterium]|nr:S8 family serine peptidase [bacterium]